MSYILSQGLVGCCTYLWEWLDLEGKHSTLSDIKGNPEMWITRDSKVYLRQKGLCAQLMAILDNCEIGYHSNQSCGRGNQKQHTIFTNKLMNSGAEDNLSFSPK